MEGNVAIITHQFSVVVKSMERGLAEKGYNVSLIKDDIFAIREMAADTQAFILYLQDSIVGDMDLTKSVLLLCDTFQDLNRNMILIGSETCKDALLGNIPALTKYIWINRPIDMDELGEEIEREIKKSISKKGKKKILIIDDDAFYAQMIIKWLENSYNVEAVNDGMQGISWLAKNKVDLILLDYEMPVVDGPKILEMLRTHPDTESIPVIFLTGIGTKESIARVMKLKPQGYVLKSTTNEELNKTIGEFFDKQTKLQ
jgi:CheY-like chemotaxis protein